ncbi:MAG: hypothetical protein OEU63_08535, partial [Gammaproteobacteria bacterium]|nr:hypothetical protein [Gammaproteobacteria bacterium]
GYSECNILACVQAEAAQNHCITALIPEFSVLTDRLRALAENIPYYSHSEYKQDNIPPESMTT